MRISTASLRTGLARPSLWPVPRAWLRVASGITSELASPVASVAALGIQPAHWAPLCASLQPLPRPPPQSLPRASPRHPIVVLERRLEPNLVSPWPLPWPSPQHRRSYCHSRRLATALASSLWPLPRASSQLSSAVAPIAATFPWTPFRSLPRASSRASSQGSPQPSPGYRLSSYRLDGPSSSAAVASTGSTAQQLSPRQAQQLGSYHPDGLRSLAAIASTGSAATASTGSAAFASSRLDGQSSYHLHDSAAQRLSPQRAQQLSSCRLDGLSSCLFDRLGSSAGSAAQQLSPRWAQQLSLR